MHIKLELLCSAAAAAVLFGGCVSVEIREGQADVPRTVSVSDQYLVRSVSSIEPVANIDRQEGRITLTVEKIRLHGSFVHSRTEVQETSIVGDVHLAMGAFPGVLSCKNEEKNAVVNGLIASWFNIVYLGLPTVYGLLFEPFDVRPLERVDSFFEAGSFRRSPLLGFVKYTKPVVKSGERKQIETLRSMDLSDIVISCPQKNARSSASNPLVVSFTDEEAAEMGSETAIEFLLPSGHPLKQQLSEYEQVPLSVNIKSK